MHEWDQHYRQLTQPEPYGDQTSYEKAARWLSGCSTVADWGCGKGWFRTFRPDCVTIDGSESPFADVVADLATYEGVTEGLLLRHVLEHNHNWAEILDNAVRSFTKCACIVIFTVAAETTHVLQTEPAYGHVPVIAFNDDDLTCRFGCDWTTETIISSTFYKSERIFYLSKC